MKTLIKLLGALAVFSLVFLALRFYGSYVGYDINKQVSDLGGLTYLYSTVAAIFAVLAAYVIVSESQDWNALNAASKNEVQELNEIWLWSKKLSSGLSQRFSKQIQSYLLEVINDEWKILEQGKESSLAEKRMEEFHDLISEALKENKELGEAILSSFDKLLSYRAGRLEYSYQPLPTILKFTVFFVDIVVILLSLLIGVRNSGLDYIFMICIATLGFIVFIVIQDLDNPLRPGAWYLGPDSHKILLHNIETKS